MIKLLFLVIAAAEFARSMIPGSPSRLSRKSVTLPPHLRSHLEESKDFYQSHMTHSFTSSQSSYSRSMSMEDDDVIFKPRFHFSAPEDSFIGDPCGPMYHNGKYHLYYQHHHNRATWELPISWGHATSTDLLHWTDEPLALIPDNTRQQIGVFSGSALSNGFNGYPTLFYTGAYKLPIYYGDPYIQGSERQHIAYSTDGMETWVHHDQDLKIDLPDHQWMTSGWRDPFVFEDQLLAAMVNRIERVHRKLHFMILSGGSKNHIGGAVFLYWSSDFVSWTPLPTPMFWRHATDTTSLKPDGFDEFSFGENFELSHLVEFKDAPQHARHALIVCTEGNFPNRNRGVISMLGSFRIVAIEESQFPVAYSDVAAKLHYTIEFVPANLQVFDYGTLYAANSFFDQINHRRVLFGWMTEDWERDDQSYWSGMMTLPRVLNWKQIDGKLFMTQKPLPEAKHFRKQVYHHFSSSAGLLSANWRDGFIPLPVNLRSGEILIRGHPRQCSLIKLAVFQNDDFSEKAVITYDLMRHQIWIDRSESNLAKDEPSKTFPEGGYFDLMNESLELRVFLDRSSIEVFANGRYSLSTRVYPHDANSDGVSLWTNLGCDFGKVDVWPLG